MAFSFLVKSAQTKIEIPHFAMFFTTCYHGEADVLMRGNGLAMNSSGLEPLHYQNEMK